MAGRSEEVAIEKVKQALRDKDPSKSIADDPNHFTNNIEQSDQQKYSFPAASESTVEDAAIIRWLRAASHSLTGLQRAQSASVNPHALSLHLQQQMNGHQQLSHPIPQPLEQQYLEHLRQLQLRSQLSALVTNQLGGGPPQLTNEQLLALRRREEVWGALNQQANPPFVAPATLQARSVEDIRHAGFAQLAALTMLREQQQVNRDIELFTRNHNVFGAGRGIPPPFGSAVAIGSFAQTLNSVLLSRMQHQRLSQQETTSIPESRVFLSHIAPPLPTASLTQPPFLPSDDQISAAIAAGAAAAATGNNDRSPSVSSGDDDDRKRKADDGDDNSTDTSLPSAESSGKEESVGKKPAARDLLKKPKRSSE